MEEFDVVVVGAGPAGSLAARAAVESGARTLLLDRRAELGEPVQCGEFLPTPGELADIFHSPDLIGEAFQIPPETVLRETHWMACVAPSGRRFRFPLSGYMVSRRAFDKALACAAEGAGAELRYPVGVARVKGERVEMVNGTTVRAKVIIGADGPISTVARSVGFTPAREMFRMITATTDGAGGDEIDLYFGRSAPGGYAWSFPRSTDSNVGLGVTELPSGESLSSLLDRFLERERLGVARERTRWWVPIGPPPDTLVFGRALFCGDAANLVMATNGGGIPTAMLSGWLAGRAAAHHAREGAPLSEYDRAWRSVLAPPLARGHRIKETTDRIVRSDLALTLGMRYIGASGLDAVMRLRWPRRLGRAS
jgi:digeranylgeranylglycerophospholipid reductase